jgi:hypothetical protein
MLNRTIHQFGSAAAAVLAFQLLVFAGADFPGVAPRGIEGVIAWKTGFATERLSGRQMRLWKAIRGIVLAHDPAGRPLHPKLRRLWQDVETSGCCVHIEMADTHPMVASRAGEFLSEEMDSNRRIRSATIRLYLGTIDRGRVRNSQNTGGGFEIFKDLGRVERCAIVLGHELAHAAAALTDPAQGRLMLELWRETETYYRIPGLRAQDRLSCLKRIALLSDLVEQAAESADTELWAELAAGR